MGKTQLRLSMDFIYKFLRLREELTVMFVWLAT